MKIRIRRKHYPAPSAATREARLPTPQKTTPEEPGCPRARCFWGCPSPFAHPHVPRRCARQAEAVSEGSPSSDVDTGTPSCGQSTRLARAVPTGDGDRDRDGDRDAHPGAAHGHGQAGQGGRGAHPEEERVPQPHGVEVHPLLAQPAAEVVQDDAGHRLLLPFLPFLHPGARRPCPAAPAPHGAHGEGGHRLSAALGTAPALAQAPTRPNFPS